MTSYLLDSAFDMDEEDLNDELELPPALRGLTFQEKKQLYKYKQSHSNVEWESELMTRQEQYERNKDLERLMKMGGGDDDDKEESSDDDVGPRGGKRKAKKESSSRGRGKRVVDSDVEESVASSEDEEGMIDDSDDNDDDDLFDSDEENDIIKNSKSKSKSKKSRKESGRRSNAARKKSRLDEYEEADTYIYGSDDGSADMYDGDRYTAARKMRILPKGEDSDDEFYTEMPRSLKQVSAKLVEPVEMASHEDYKTIQLKRDFAIMYQADPAFNDSAIGCFVRFFKRSAGVGEGKYLMCEIIDVIKRSTYKFQDSNINIALTLTIGDKKYPKPVKLSDVSNSRITEEEYNEYLASLRKINKPSVKPLTKKQLNKRRENFKQITSRSITDDEVRSKIEASDVTIMSKEAIQKQIADAHRDEPDEGKRGELLEKLQKRLDAIEREEEYNKAIMMKAANMTSSLNKKNKQKNIQLDKEASAKRKKQAKELAARGLNPSALENPFDRKETVPRSIWVTGGTKVKDKAEQEQKKREIEKAALEAKKAVDEAAAAVNNDKDQFISTNNILEIRERVKQRLGYDPLEFVHTSKHTRYLHRASSLLPPKNSDEREIVRGEYFMEKLGLQDLDSSGWELLSLEQWLGMKRQQRQ